jgi:phosphomannomutase
VLADLEREYAAREGVELDHLDGLTVAHRDWWFNVRASNTEPLLRLNAEAGDETTLARVRDDVLAQIRTERRHP